MTRPVLLTGATGFLGMEVLARLLDQGRDVLALVRAPDVEGAQERLDGVLATLYRDPRPVRCLVRPLRGDLTAPGLGLAAPDRARIAAEAGAIVHCAASISFSLALAEAREVNVAGTRRVLELAQDCRSLERLVHVSTAYVAGMHGGCFREEQLDAGQRFRNTYEQTKHEAERLVAASGIPGCVVRPSIVVGESDSGWTPVFNVLYWPLRAFARGLFAAVPGDPRAHVDVVPVDYVADGIVALLDRRDAEGTFNLVAGRETCTAGELLDLACGWFERARPPFVDPRQGAGTATDGDGAVYLPYFDMDLVFDDRRARALLAPQGARAPRLPDYFGRLMEYAELARWGKRGLVREEARERVEAMAAA
jgi:thioester reductase-like protein